MVELGEIAVQGLDLSALLARMPIVNYAQRDQIQIRATLHLRHETRIELR